MFEDHFSDAVFEVSHKLVNNPVKENYANHMHTYCEIVLFVTGDVNYNIDGNMYAPKKYDLMFIPKDTYHFLLPYCDTTYENYVLSFRSDIISQEQYNKVFSYPYIVNVSEMPFILDFFSRLDNYKTFLSNKDFEDIAKCMIKELLIYCSYIDKTAYSSEISNNPIVKNVISYITKNIKAPLNIRIIADSLGLSTSYIQNTFSKNMNIGLKQYILKRKIFAARNDIRQGEHPVSVSLDYGFNDYSCFYRNYKKILGSSPKTKNNKK